VSALAELQSFSLGVGSLGVGTGGTWELRWSFSVRRGGPRFVASCVCHSSEGAGAWLNDGTFSNLQGAVELEENVSTSFGTTCRLRWWIQCRWLPVPVAPVPAAPVLVAPVPVATSAGGSSAGGSSAGGYQCRWLQCRWLPVPVAPVPVAPVPVAPVPVATSAGGSSAGGSSAGGSSAQSLSSISL
jgi:hypothetical protein